MRSLSALTSYPFRCRSPTYLRSHQHFAISRMTFYITTSLLLKDRIGKNRVEEDTSEDRKGFFLKIMLKNENVSGMQVYAVLLKKMCVIISMQSG